MIIYQPGKMIIYQPGKMIIYVPPSEPAQDIFQATRKCTTVKMINFYKVTVSHGASAKST